MFYKNGQPADDAILVIIPINKMFTNDWNIASISEDGSFLFEDTIPYTRLGMRPFKIRVVSQYIFDEKIIYSRSQLEEEDYFPLL